jgi:hypothetical protein
MHGIAASALKTRIGSCVSPPPAWFDSLLILVSVSRRPQGAHPRRGPN